MKSNRRKGEGDITKIRIFAESRIRIMIKVRNRVCNGNSLVVKFISVKISTLLCVVWEFVLMNL